MKLTIAFLFAVGTIIQIVQSGVIETNENSVTLTTVDVPATTHNIVHNTKEAMSKGYNWARERISAVSEDLHKFGMQAKEEANLALGTSKYSDRILERVKRIIDSALKKSDAYAKLAIDEMEKANLRAKSYIDGYVDKTNQYANYAIRKMSNDGYRGVEEEKEVISYSSGTTENMAMS